MMMSKNAEVNRLREQNAQLQMENDSLKTERMELSASVARLKRELAESRMRQADLVERSQRIHIL